VLAVDEEIPDGGTFAGLGGVRDYMTLFLEPWSELTIEATSIEELGDTYFVTVLQRGTGRGSSASTELSYFHVWTFRGVKAIRIDVLLDEARARALLAGG
jgi:SnoaL-like domain